MATESLYGERDTEPGPLAGVRVIDLTIARAGPTCVRQLADMGAEVIRVSSPGRFDLGGSDAFNLHRDKRSILLDLSTGCRSFGSAAKACITAVGSVPVLATGSVHPHCGRRATWPVALSSTARVVK